MTPYVVVAFSARAEPDWCDVVPCPSGCYGPFDTPDEASALAARMPGWQQPHVLRVEEPSSLPLQPESELSPHE